MATDELIGCRIDVWWPMDKRFYEGTVKSYDSTKQKHVILYEDGDVEVFRLDKERSELIDSGKPTKKAKTSKRSSNKKGSSGSKHKNSDALRRDEDPLATTPKGKRTPKYIKHKHPEETPGSPSSEHEKRESRTKKNRSTAIIVGEVVEETNENKTGSDTEQMTENHEHGKVAGEEKSESEGKSWKKGLDVDDEVDLQEAKVESRGNPEGKKTDVDNSDSEKKEENDDMDTEAEAEDDAADADASDNETLGAWRSKVVKSSLLDTIGPKLNNVRSMKSSS